MTTTNLHRPPASVNVPRSFPAAGLLAAALALAGAVVLVVAQPAVGDADQTAATVAVVGWAVGAVVLARRRPHEPVAVAVAMVALFGALAMTGNDLALGLLVGAIFHLAVGLPAGGLSRRSSAVVAVAYAAAGIAGVVSGDEHGLLIAAGVVLGAGAAAVVVRTCRRATARERSRLQWAGWGAIVTASVTVAAWALDALTGWPDSVLPVVTLSSLAIPVGLVLATSERGLAVVGRVLVHTIVAAGMAVLVMAAYLLVVVGFRGLPTAEERAVLVLSMVAAGVVAVVSLPVRRRLEAFANLRVYGERQAPDEALRTFANRMSRAVPMDELLLQLAETLRKTMGLSSAEVWTGGDGVYDRAVAVPDRPPARLTLNVEEHRVAARAQVAGNAWLAVWIPQLCRDDAILRVACVTHLGDLLGFIVAERRSVDADFDEEQDRVLVDLARQLGLALHNVRLDAALQASLDELQVRNRELVASRARIVAAADESRRRIERDLHDGAQQHLVAMAVKIGLARQLLTADANISAAMLDELREDAQVTLTQLRELAHGIYPPLLMTRGLPEALQAAANRAVLPTTVVAEDVHRYAPDVEAAVYFCCLEAVQNAGKHAGAGANITVAIGHEDDVLWFAVSDDGAGFSDDAVEGHGFVNMRDRLGAIGGTLEVRSAPGAGTTVEGRIRA